MAVRDGHLGERRWRVLHPSATLRGLTWLKNGWGIGVPQGTRGDRSGQKFWAKFGHKKQQEKQEPPPPPDQN